MKPTIGRIVHYQQVCAYGPETPPEVAAQPMPLLTRAAIVTDIHEVEGVECPVLRVLGRYPGEDFPVDCAPGVYEREGVQFSEEPRMGCWNWPPRA